MAFSNSALLSTATPTSIALSQNSNVAQLPNMIGCDVTATITGANPSNIAFTAAITDICTTATAHGFTTGVLVRFTTTGTLPAGLSLATDYYLTVLSDTTFKVSSSQADVVAGVFVDITDTGTGVHTVAVTTALAGSIKLQKSNSNLADPTVIWVDLDDTEILNGNNSQSFAAAGSKNWLVDHFFAQHLRAVVTVTSGTVTADIRLTAKAGG